MIRAGCGFALLVMVSAGCASDASSSRRKYTYDTGPEAPPAQSAAKVPQPAWSAGDGSLTDEERRGLIAFVEAQSGGPRVRLSDADTAAGERAIDKLTRRHRPPDGARAQDTILALQALRDDVFAEVEAAGRTELYDAVWQTFDDEIPVDPPLHGPLSAWEGERATALMWGDVKTGAQRLELRALLERGAMSLRSSDDADAAPPTRNELQTVIAALAFSYRPREAYTFVGRAGLYPCPAAVTSAHALLKAVYIAQLRHASEHDRFTHDLSALDVSPTKNAQVTLRIDDHTDDTFVAQAVGTAGGPLAGRTFAIDHNNNLTGPKIQSVCRNVQPPPPLPQQARSENDNRAIAAALSAQVFGSDGLSPQRVLRGQQNLEILVEQYRSPKGATLKAVMDNRRALREAMLSFIPAADTQLQAAVRARLDERAPVFDLPGHGPLTEQEEKRAAFVLYRVHAGETVAAQEQAVVDHFLDRAVEAEAGLRTHEDPDALRDEVVVRLTSKYRLDDEGAASFVRAAKVRACWRALEPARVYLLEAYDAQHRYAAAHDGQFAKAIDALNLAPPPSPNVRFEIDTSAASPYVTATQRGALPHEQSELFVNPRAQRTVGVKHDACRLLDPES